MAIVYDLETDIRYLQGKKIAAEETAAPAMLRGLQEGRKEGQQKTKQEDIMGLLRLGMLTNEQIAQALDVSTDFVLNIQIGMRPSATNE